MHLVTTDDVLLYDVLVFIPLVEHLQAFLVRLRRCMSIGGQALCVLFVRILHLQIRSKEMRFSFFLFAREFKFSESAVKPMAPRPAEKACPYARPSLHWEKQGLPVGSALLLSFYR